MRTIKRIMKTELRVLFFSPIAWIVLVVFAFQLGLTYCDGLAGEIRDAAMGYRPYNVTMYLMAGYSGAFSEMLKNLYLYIPLLTMGLMSREFSSGSIKLLYSSPVSNMQIVIGKYLSVLVYGMVLIGLMALPLILTACVVKDADMPLMLTAMLGVFLTIAAYTAIGLFMSTITKYQVVAVIATMAVLAVLNFIGNFGRDIDFVRDLTYWLSISGRSSVFLEGMICSKDVVYFVLVIFMFLAFTFIKLQGERLKKTKIETALRYVSVLCIVLGLGYFSSRPMMIAYYDSTATKQNTLAVESQEVMGRIDDRLTMTTYVNLLDKTWYNASPSSKIMDMERFEKFVRFKPDMKIEYVYYYGPGTNDFYDERFAGLSPKEKMEKVCEIYDYNPKMFVSAKDVAKMDDISKENGRLVRVLKRENGTKSYLRVYDDQYVHPFEDGITTAFKTLTEKAPLIAFVTGHDERSCEDYGEKGYAAFATNRTFRSSLINNGFDVTSLTLDKPVPENVNVLVIADMRSPMSENEFTNYKSFVENGGNLIIMGEPKRIEFMNPLVNELGLRFADGILVSPTEQYPDDIIAANIQARAVSVSPYFSRLIQEGKTIITPSATAVEVIDSTKGFTISEILSTSPQGSWIEYETVNFIDEKSSVNPQKGEVEKSNSVMLYLTKEMEGKPQQRIFVLGDADCLSTKEMTVSRAGLNGANYNLITEMFYCMSYGEYPVRTQSVRPPDDELYIGRPGLWVVKIFFIGLIPLSILITCIVFLARRKRR